jgi:hypothetical protein
MTSNYTFKTKKAPAPRRCYTVVRNSDELVLGEVFRDGDEKGWTSFDVSGCEAWPFSDRESAAQSLERWHAKARDDLMRRVADNLAEIVAEPEMIDADRSLTIDDFDRAIACVRELASAWIAGPGPAFTCIEAETFVDLLRATGCDDLVESFKTAHAEDDEDGDLHADGWPAEQTLGPEDSRGIS